MSATTTPESINLPQGINFDTVLREILHDMAYAADGWANKHAQYLPFWLM
jgi:hypothetical protein